MVRILLIDDEPVVRQTLGQLLKLGGHDVSLAEDGLQGLQLAREEEFAVVITDINMPGKDGLATIDELQGELPPGRIIAISGGSTDVAADDCLEIARAGGAALVLQKPFSSKDLLSAIDSLIAA